MFKQLNPLCPLKITLLRKFSPCSPGTGDMSQSTSPQGQHTNIESSAKTSLLKLFGISHLIYSGYTILVRLYFHSCSVLKRISLLLFKLCFSFMFSFGFGNRLQNILTLSQRTEFWTDGKFGFLHFRGYILNTATNTLSL